MDTIIQQTYVAPAKIDLHKLDDEPSSHRSTITATEQLAEQTAQTIEDIRKCRAWCFDLAVFFPASLSSTDDVFFQHLNVLFQLKPFHP